MTCPHCGDLYRILEYTRPVLAPAASPSRAGSAARRAPGFRIIEREPIAPPRRSATSGSVLCTGVIRRKRTEQRERARAMRKLVRDREKLARLSAGGSADRPIHVVSASVVEVRVNRLTCPQCDGEYRLKEHRAPASGLRSVDVTCQVCGVSRTLWFRIVSDAAN